LDKSPAADVNLGRRNPAGAWHYPHDNPQGGQCRVDVGRGSRIHGGGQQFVERLEHPLHRILAGTSPGFAAALGGGGQLLGDAVPLLPLLLERGGKLGHQPGGQRREPLKPGGHLGRQPVMLPHQGGAVIGTIPATLTGRHLPLERGPQPRPRFRCRQPLPQTLQHGGLERLHRNPAGASLLVFLRAPHHHAVTVHRATAAAPHQS
jgi:hypothetical protein